MHSHCQSRAEAASQHTQTQRCHNANTNRLCVFNNSFAFVFFCQQVLRGRQVFPKKQHDFVSNGLWGGPAEWELWDTGSIVGTSWQQHSAPHFTHDMDVLLHLEKDKQLSACLQYFLRPLYQSLRTLVNVQLFALPTPQHWAVTNFDVQLCLLSWALYCLYVLWNLFQVCFLFLLEMVHWRVCTVCFLCIYKLEHLFYEM